MNTRAMTMMTRTTVTASRTRLEPLRLSISGLRPLRLRPWLVLCRYLQALEILVLVHDWLQLGNLDTRRLQSCRISHFTLGCVAFNAQLPIWFCRKSVARMLCRLWIKSCSLAFSPKHTVLSWYVLTLLVCFVTVPLGEPRRLSVHLP